MNRKPSDKITSKRHHNLLVALFRFIAIQSEITENHAIVTDLTPGDSYSFKISASNDYAESDLSEILDIHFLVKPDTPSFLREV